MSIYDATGTPPSSLLGPNPNWYEFSVDPNGTHKINVNLSKNCDVNVAVFSTNPPNSTITTLNDLSLLGENTASENSVTVSFSTSIADQTIYLAVSSQTETITASDVCINLNGNAASFSFVT